MDIYKSKTWLCDLDAELSVLPEIQHLSGKTVFITGATGLVCSAVVDLLIRYNEIKDANITIVVAGRSIDRMKNRYYPFADRPYMNFVLYDAVGTGNTDILGADFIIHGASNASPNKIVKEPVETMMSNITGLKNLLDQARINTSRRILVVSSSEVYGNKNNDSPFREDEYGFIDLLNSRNSYSIAKRAAETLCASYCDEYGVDYVITRPGHIYGPTALESDNRVSSAWAYSVARGEDIVMKSDGGQIRSYCYCLDCASAIIKVLLLGESAKAYNISNPNSVISIKEMAQLLACSAGVNLKFEIPSETEIKGFNPMKNSSLDSSSLMNLGWEGLFDAKTGFSHTVSVIKESKQYENCH